MSSKVVVYTHRDDGFAILREPGAKPKTISRNEFKM